MLTICTAVRQSTLRRQHGIRRMEWITCVAVYRKIISMTEPISIANDRKASDVSGVHGTYKAPCDVCQPLIDFLGIEDIH